MDKAGRGFGRVPLEPSRSHDCMRGNQTGLRLGGRSLDFFDGITSSACRSCVGGRGSSTPMLCDGVLTFLRAVEAAFNRYVGTVAGFVFLVL